MKINYVNKTIEMNKREAKKASIIGSEEYKALVGAKRDFPTYSIKIVSRDVKKSDDIKGLTYDFMEKYIENNGTKEQRSQYDQYRDGVGDTKASYVKIRIWFLNEFPQILEFREKIKAISLNKRAV